MMFLSARVLSIDVMSPILWLIPLSSFSVRYTEKRKRAGFVESGPSENCCNYPLSVSSLQWLPILPHMPLQSLPADRQIL
jgi:hypothetical protein